MISVFAGCQIPYPKREFLTEEEPDDKGDKVSIKVELKASCFSLCYHHIFGSGVFCSPSELNLVFLFDQLRRTSSSSRATTTLMALVTQGTKTAVTHRDPRWKKWELFLLPLPQVDWSWPQTIRYFKVVLYWSAVSVFARVCDHWEMGCSSEKSLLCLGTHRREALSAWKSADGVQWRELRLLS